MYVRLFLIGVLVVVGLVLVKGNQFVLAAPKNTPAPSATPLPTPSVDISVVSPNGGEQFRQGILNTIKWNGGFRVVAVGLATPDAVTTNAIAVYDYPTYSSNQRNGVIGKIIGFINTREGQGYHLPNSSFAWDGLKVCNYHPNLDPDAWCKDVTPGSYKIFVWSQNADGSMSIGSGTGPTGKYTTRDTRGNWDVSDQPFIILAP